MLERPTPCQKTSSFPRRPLRFTSSFGRRSSTDAVAVHFRVCSCSLGWAIRRVHALRPVLQIVGTGYASIRAGRPAVVRHPPLPLHKSVRVRRPPVTFLVRSVRGITPLCRRVENDCPGESAVPSFFNRVLSDEAVTLLFEDCLLCFAFFLFRKTKGCNEGI